MYAKIILVYKTNKGYAQRKSAFKVSKAMKQ